MRIVIATPFYPPEKGVSATYSSKLEEAFTRMGHTVAVLPYSVAGRLPPGIKHLAYFWKLFSAARGSDAVLALDTWSVGMPAYFAARLARTKLIVRIGGDFLWETYVERTKKPIRFSELYRPERDFNLKERSILRFHRMLVHGAHRLLFNSQFQRTEWQRVYAIPEGAAGVLENVFPKERAMHEPQGYVFVSAGRPIALKNYHGLERAFAKVRERYPSIELDQRMLPRDEHMMRLQNCYAVIIPSVSEMSSNTAVDAFVNGKPFIMTADTGTKERLHDCGIFIDPRSEEELTTAIEQLLDPAAYDRLRANIRALSFSRTWDDLAKEILAAL